MALVNARQSFADAVASTRKLKGQVRKRREGYGNREISGTPADMFSQDIERIGHKQKNGRCVISHEL